jgi:hypothetical protein
LTLNSRLVNLLKQCLKQPKWIDQLPQSPRHRQAAIGLSLKPQCKALLVQPQGALHYPLLVRLLAVLLVLCLAVLVQFLGLLLALVQLHWLA